MSFGALAFEVLLLLQTDLSDIHIDISLYEGLAGGAVSAFATTLVLGAIMLAVAPEYTKGKMASLEDEPGNALAYGIFALLALIIAVVMLVISIVGILVAIPLAMVAVLVWAVGAAIAYTLIGDRLVGHDDGWGKPLLVGAAINGGLTISGIGGLVAFVIGAAGFGVILRDYLD